MTSSIVQPGLTKNFAGVGSRFFNSRGSISYFIYLFVTGGLRSDTGG
jgi:hypothetical protein